jgi:ssDNA-binding Zn-finger/Zn-ribbon topoisomerase 1
MKTRRSLVLETEVGGPERPVRTAREVISIRNAQDELASARCPLCRAVLVVRQGRAGPYFYCRCAPRKDRPQAA